VDITAEKAAVEKAIADQLRARPIRHLHELSWLASLGQALVREAMTKLRLGLAARSMSWTVGVLPVPPGTDDRGLAGHQRGRPQVRQPVL